MPAFATAAVSALGAALGGAFGATLIMSAEAIGSALLTGGLLVGSVAVATNSARKAREQAREQYNASQVDRFANVVTTVGPRELVLGRVRKGGNVIFRGSTGTNKTTFAAVIALAGHEIDAVEQVYLNDEPVELDSDGYVTTAPYARYVKTTVNTSIEALGSSVVLDHTPLAESVFVFSNEESGAGAILLPFTLSGSTVTLDEAAEFGATVSYQYESLDSYARIWFDLGTATTADSRMRELFPDLWTANHVARGVAKLFFQATYDETAYPSGLPLITATIRGAKVFDPRDDSTAWSENPALLARHVYQHARFGKATVSEDEDDRFSTAANDCDTAQNWIVDGVTTAGVLFKAGLVVPYGAPARDALDDLCKAMGGMWAYAGGELFLRSGVYTASVMTLTDSDLAVIQRVGEQESQEPVSISVHREQAQKFNTVNLRIWDEDQDYKKVPLSPVVGSALVTRDTKTLAQEVSLAAVTYAPQAQHVAGIMMRDARDPLTFEAPWKLKAWPLELFDTVSVTLDRYGWSSKTFVILKREWDRARGIVKLTMKETAASIYTPDATFLPQGYAENTALPNPWDIDPPGSLTARSTTDDLAVSPSGGILDRVRVTWAPVQDSSVTNGGFVELQWTPAGSDEWQSVLAPGDATEAFLVGPAGGSGILIRARTVAKVAKSVWSVQIAHQVIGQTERPDDVTNFTVAASNGFAVATWDRATDLDVLYGGRLVVRWSTLTTGATWEDGYILEFFDGNLVQGVLPLKTGTYMAKWQDRTRNWSGSPDTFAVTEGMVTGFTTLATSTQDTAFSGTKTNLVATESILKLTGETLIDDMTDSIDSWPYIDGLGGIHASGEYLFDTYIDCTTSAVRRYEATIKVLAYDTNDLIDERTSPIDEWDAVDGDEINTCDVTLYAATTNDNPAGSPTWSDWTPFVVADFSARAAKFKLVVTSEFPTHNIDVQQLRVAVKEPA